MVYSNEEKLREAWVRDPSANPRDVARECSVAESTARRHRHRLRRGGTIPTIEVRRGPKPSENTKTQAAKRVILEDPSLLSREVAARAGCGANTAHVARRALEADGLIPVSPRRRALRERPHHATRPVTDLVVHLAAIRDYAGTLSHHRGYGRVLDPKTDEDRQLRREFLCSLLAILRNFAAVAEDFGPDCVADEVAAAMKVVQRSTRVRMTDVRRDKNP